MWLAKAFLGGIHALVDLKKMIEPTYRKHLPNLPVQDHEMHLPSFSCRPDLCRHEHTQGRGGEIFHESQIEQKFRRGRLLDDLLKLDLNVWDSGNLDVRLEKLDIDNVLLVVDGQV